MTKVIRENTVNTSTVQAVTTETNEETVSPKVEELKPYVGADVFIQHSIVDGKIVKTTGEWGKVEAVYEDYTVRIKSGDVFSVKAENSHFKTIG